MSGLPCSTCADARRPEIDAALVSGSSLRDIAGRFGTSKSALSRHRPHVGTALVRASARKGERLDESLLQKVERLEADARRLGERAEAEGDLRCALAAVREMGEVVKLLRELTPPPKRTEADLARALAWFAEETGASIDEMRAECERNAEIQAAILRGESPPHTPPPPAIKVEFKFPESHVVRAPDRVGPPAEAAPPAPSPAPARPAPPPLPFRMSV